MSIDFELKQDIAVITVDNPPVNALSHEVRAGLLECLETAVENKAKAVLIYGKGRTWFAGADIKEFGKTPLEPLLPDVCNAIEACHIPVVASMHGTALGGGLEIALSCHYRIANQDAQFGLPEVGLGLIPGAGGTQRLPRLVGYTNAIDIITSGRRIYAEEALKEGMVDKVVEGEAFDIGLDYVKSLIENKAVPRATSRLPIPKPQDFELVKADLLKRTRGQVSPVVAVDAIAASAALPFKEGLAEERRLFSKMLATEQSKALRYAFFAEREVNKVPEIDGVEARKFAQIGVIGGGTMGAGIATAALLSGLQVVLIEMSPDAVNSASERIASNLSGSLKRGKIDQNRYDEIFASSLKLSTDYATLKNADIIIEAVFENMVVKKTVFAELDNIAKPGAILASNTSYLDIDEIAATTKRPADVVGLHFFSPAHVMRLLEVVNAKHTAVDVLATSFALGKRLKKVPVVAGVCDGFIGNRILNSYRTCADHMVLDGASPFDIDNALEHFGFAMGPFAVADLAGLDIGWANRQRLAPTRDARERVPTYADTLCEQEHYGQKTGRGYYLYQDHTRKPNPEIMPLIQAERSQLGIKTREFSSDEIVKRYMLAMVNEAARVVGEGIARRPLDVDMVLMMGYGFPRHEGGPMHWADAQGLSNILNGIKALSEEDDFFWQPAELLQELVEKDKNFADLNG